MKVMNSIKNAMDFEENFGLHDIFHIKDSFLEIFLSWFIIQNRVATLCF